ncbi:hypothetical protein C8R43DRAFT_1078435 [Mycena crocata]|nr:hypothetical protein C8R43DRAFT_1078435 [Mycena crocata]
MQVWPSGTPSYKVPSHSISYGQVIANVLQWGLFGALTVQLYNYYQAFPRDKISIKTMIYSVYALELVQTVLITHDAFETFGYGFGDVSTLTKPRSQWLTIAIMSGLVALIGQTFYAYRLFMFCKSQMLPLLIISISVASGIGAFLSAAYDFQGMLSPIIYILHLWFGGSALADILIVICMTYHLSKESSQFPRTRILLSKLIRLTIETGLVRVPVATITTLALLFVFPTKTYHIVPAFLIPKLYANTILVVLNSRIQIMGGRGNDLSSGQMQSIPAVLFNTDSTNTTAHSGRIPPITITREVFLKELHAPVQDQVVAEESGSTASRYKLIGGPDSAPTL